MSHCPKSFLEANARRRNSRWHKEPTMTPHRLWSLALIIAVVCGLAVLGTPAPVAGVTPLQTCTSQNIRGFPVAGDVCGGSTHGLLCTPGALYRCQSGPLGQTNNCTLSQACPVGCLTGPTTGTLADTCFSGSPPLTLSTSNTPGGNDVTLTAVLAAIHPNGAIVNLTIDRGDLVPGSYCAVPDLAAGATSVSFAFVMQAPEEVRTPSIAQGKRSRWALLDRPQRLQ